MRDPLVQEVERVSARHVMLGTGDGAITALGTSYAPQDRSGVNGDQGFVSGTYEPQRDQEGTCTIVFPNASGGDQVLHRERFLIFQRGKVQASTDDAGTTVYKGGDYRPGDEWLELYRGAKLWGVLTPISGKISRQTVEITLADPFWLLKKVRETGAGFWCHAPRDAFEHYSTVWQAVIGDDFAPRGRTWSAGSSETNDGKWRYQATELDSDTDSAFIGSSPSPGPYSAYIASVAEIPLGRVSAEPYTAIRYEVEWTRSTAASGVPFPTFLFGLTNSAGQGLYFEEKSVGGVDTLLAHSKWSTVDLAVNTNLNLEKQPIKLAIEVRERWAYFYVNGALATVLPVPSASLTVAARVSIAIAAGGEGQWVRVSSLLLRRTRPFLMRGSNRGDLRLPGALTPGGLTASSFNDGDLLALRGSDAYRYVLNLTRQPAERSLAPVVDYTENTHGRSARFTGAIWLDLANYDYQLRLTTNRGRLWLGRTRIGEQLVEDWTGGGHAPAAVTTATLRGILGQLSGWYPIVIEGFIGAETGPGRLKLEAARSDAPATWVTPGAATTGDPAWPAPLSPSGIFESQVRFESHYDQAIAIAQAFGLQFRTDPKQLESAAFPGETLPKVRVGRDTGLVLESPDAREIASEVSAEDAADALLSDAAGLATDGAQLSAEVVDYDELDQHLFLLQEYDSQGDITIEALLVQRLRSLLALRGGVWEQVTAQPRGFRQLVDKFPIDPANPQLAEFAWEPGDGARLKLPEIGVEDAAPRPAMGVSWPFVPDGMQAPSLSWRQRQRTGKQLLRQMLKEPLTQSRNYQGQLVTVSGTIGGTGGADGFTRAALPDDIADVVRAELVVMAKSDASAQVIQVNGTNTPISITSVGRYDVTPYTASAGGPYMYAGIPGGTGTATIALELLVKK